MRALIFAVAVRVLTAPAWAAGWDDCKQEKNPDLAIKSCTAIVKNTKETAKNRALAFFHRGMAYSDKRQYEAALADYTEAVKLNPNHSASYNNRGAAGPVELAGRLPPPLVAPGGSADNPRRGGRAHDRRTDPGL